MIVKFISVIIILFLFLEDLKADKGLKSMLQTNNVKLF